MSTLVFGNNSSETLQGTSGFDTIFGMGGNDTIFGFDGTDALFGEDGHDFLFGGLGTDYLNGGAGNDFLAPGMGVATQQVDGGSGSDTISFFDWTMGVHIYLDENRARAEAYFDGSQVEFSSIENAEGSAFKDELRGNAGANILRGLAGNDSFMGGEGADTLDGGAGRDLADYADSNAGVSVDLRAQNNTGNWGGSAEGDTLISIEDLDGSMFQDVLQGSDGANALFGAEGDDFLIGWAGRDTLEGGLGKDHLWGGDDRDSFVFRDVSESVGANRDVIHDFQEFFLQPVGPYLMASHDVIDLSRIDAIKNESPYHHHGWPDDFTLVAGALTEVGQLHVRHSGGNTFVEGCTTQAGVIDFQIELTGTHNLTQEHFIF